MQSFGRNPELQVAKLEEVVARSASLGKIVQKMLTKDPKQRISSAMLAEELASAQQPQPATTTTLNHEQSL